jgi:hypothetical protein
MKREEEKLVFDFIKEIRDNCTFLSGNDEYCTINFIYYNNKSIKYNEGR